jgi:hypothetical protein
MAWHTLRKTTASVIVEREYTHDTMFAENFRLRVDDETPMIDLSVDLNKSLRTRSKGVSTYVDAKNMSERRLRDFKGMAIDDEEIVRRLRDILTHVEFEIPSVWRLHISLAGDYWFNVQPEWSKRHAYERWTFDVQSVIPHHPPMD